MDARVHRVDGDESHGGHQQIDNDNNVAYSEQTSPCLCAVGVYKYYYDWTMDTRTIIHYIVLLQRQKFSDHFLTKFSRKSWYLAHMAKCNIVIATEGETRVTFIVNAMHGTVYARLRQARRFVCMDPSRTEIVEWSSDNLSVFVRYVSNLKCIIGDFVFRLNGPTVTQNSPFLLWRKKCTRSGKIAFFDQSTEL